MEMWVKKDFLCPVCVIHPIDGEFVEFLNSQSRK